MTVEGDADFSGAAFGGDARFAGAVIAGDATFRRVVFAHIPTVGPLVCSGTLDLTEAVFENAVTVEAAAAACTRRVCGRESTRHV